MKKRAKILLYLLITCTLAGCAPSSDYELATVVLTSETLTEKEKEDRISVLTLEKLKEGVEALDEIERAEISQIEEDSTLAVEIQITFSGNVKQKEIDAIRAQIEEYAKAFLTDDKLVIVKITS